MKETTLQELAETFDAFFVDQFGVLLDGAGAYPGAADALTALAKAGKRIFLVSNSGRRSGPNEERLARLGFDRSSYEAIITSGEVARECLRHRMGQDIEPGSPVLVLSREDDLSCIEGLDLSVTEDSALARLVLIAGSRGEEVPLGDYARLLRNPARRKVPALCTNPDMTMLTGRGPAFGAGKIAALYQKLGGTVDYVGKPHPLIYRFAIDRMDGVDLARIVCIGDSPAHDIRGGHGAGVSTALVRTGIHADEPLDAVLANAPTGDVPDFVIPRFVL